MSITTPAGFVAAGLAAGIKASGALDLALLATEDGRPVPTAATFTRNLAGAAPVQVSRAHLASSGGRAAAVLVSSGNANAATGDRGRADATTMCRLTAEELGVATEEVLVCSTGLIGIPLPMDVIEAGIPAVVAARSGGAGAAADAAAGILTTDSSRKEVLVAHPTFTVAGMAKGAGMLAPNMATMLAFLTTDAAVEPGPLADVLRAAVADSFNSMSVDGCTSTNDTVVLMASGRAGACDPNVLVDAVTEVCADLSRLVGYRRGVRLAVDRAGEHLLERRRLRAAAKARQALVDRGPDTALVGATVTTGAVGVLALGGAQGRVRGVGRDGDCARGAQADPEAARARGAIEGRRQTRGHQDRLWPGRSCLGAQPCSERWCRRSSWSFPEPRLSADSWPGSQEPPRTMRRPVGIVS